MSEISAMVKPSNRNRAVQELHAEISLMRKIADGDEAAFLELVRIHGDQLAKTIGRLTAWSSDTDDILQEVFITIWQKAGQYSGKGCLEGWLKRIAINHCRNQFQLRNAIARKLASFAEWLGGRRNQILARTRECDHVESALARLSLEDRTVLVLYYLEEMSGEQVADILEISSEAVHVRLFRARKRLKSILQDQRADD